jgi:hypothetical protein
MWQHCFLQSIMFVRDILIVQLSHNIDILLIKYVTVTKITGYFQNECSEPISLPVSLLRAVIETENFGKRYTKFQSVCKLLNS